MKPTIRRRQSEPSESPNLLGGSSTKPIYHKHHRHLAWAQLRERKHGERERRMEIERENISVGEREKSN